MIKQQSLLEIHLAVLLFGLAGLFGKWLSLSPVIIVFGRVVFASIALALLLLFTKKSLQIIPRKNYLLFFSLGIILAIHWISFFKSIQVSTVAVGLLSYSSFPIFTALLEPLFFREKIVAINILFALLCFCGIYLIIPEFNLANSVYQGVLWGLLSGITFAFLTIANRRLSQKYSSLVIAFFQDFFAAIILLPLFFVKQTPISTKNLFLLIILGVFCTAGAHSLFIKSMRYIKAQTASIISSLEPVYGIVLALFLLGEIPELRTISGGAIILGTAFTVSLRTIKRGDKRGQATF
ncbi:MAG: DMT family transporter [Candidatus Aminicenantaceae bacterium]